MLCSCFQTLSARAFGLGGGPDPTGTWPSGFQVGLANGNVLLGPGGGGRGERGEGAHGSSHVTERPAPLSAAPPLSPAPL